MGLFASVPVEVLIHMMAFLPLHELALCSTLVCKAWRPLFTAVPALWWSLEVPRFVSLLNRIPAGSVQALTLKNPFAKGSNSNKHVYSTVDEQKAIKQLIRAGHGNFCSVHLTKKVANSVLTLMAPFLGPSLKSLTLFSIDWRTVDFEDRFGKAQNLVEFRYVTFETSCVFAEFWRFFDKLDSISMSGVYLQLDHGLCLPVRMCLTKLDVTVEHVYSKDNQEIDRFYNEVITKAPMLKTLRMAISKHIYWPVNFPNLHSHSLLKHLESLTVENFRVSNDDVTTVITPLVYVLVFQSLVFKGCTHLTGGVEVEVGDANGFVVEWKDSRVACVGFCLHKNITYQFGDMDLEEKERLAPLFTAVPALWWSLEVPRFVSLLPRIPAGYVQALTLKNPFAKITDSSKYVYSTTDEQKAIKQLIKAGHGNFRSVHVDKKAVNSVLTRIIPTLGPSLKSLTIFSINWRTIDFHACFGKVQNLVEFGYLGVNNSFDAFWRLFDKLDSFAMSSVYLQLDFAFRLPVCMCLTVAIEHVYSKDNQEIDRFYNEIITKAPMLKTLRMAIGPQLNWPVGFPKLHPNALLKHLESLTIENFHVSNYHVTAVIAPLVDVFVLQTLVFKNCTRLTGGSGVEAGNGNGFIVEWE
ncbi:hypothetical protein HDU98_002348 [Podochytrium sp. JEL0797]|nr:hypothetical protein HDU98_002348 [Podochytrium sp. JEL0797]